MVIYFLFSLFGGVQREDSFRIILLAQDDDSSRQMFAKVQVW